MKKSKLSQREEQILELISIGFTNSEIAILLYLSVETIKTHRKNLIRKMGARNVAHLIRIAAETGQFITNRGRPMLSVAS